MMLLGSESPRRNIWGDQSSGRAVRAIDEFSSAGAVVQFGGSRSSKRRISSISMPIFRDTSRVHLFLRFFLSFFPFFHERRCQSNISIGLIGGRILVHQTLVATTIESNRGENR